MRKIILLLLVPFSSCTAYQYFTLTGENMQQNQRNEYVTENDTVRITYNFNGKDCPITLTIFNKTGKPLIIDWKKSAIIIKDSATSYYSTVYQIKANESGYVSHYSRSYNSDITGNIYTSEESAFIPPNSSISRTPIQIHVNALGEKEFESLQKRDLNLDNVHVIKYQEKKFTKDDAPLNFRSYLTLNFQGDEKEFSMESSFFVAEVKRFNVGPPLYTVDKGNTFYIRTTQ